ncbi:RIP metalloprotease RseP [Patescibacteria group bacterium]|nr:RIP metalloprotease RseP [Patescibacteria group bacterium]MBU1921856.1 RIP metalloprotease RseP [Patescibacteria group bacterium]
MLTAIIIFFVILSVIVFVHEMGHFLAARIFGVKAEEFGFGFPPRVFGVVKNDQNKWELVRGNSEKQYKNTIWSLNWIPVGGFVKIKGESGEAEHEPDSLISKKIWKRAIILSAGVIMNLVLAAVILSFGFMVGLPSVVEDLPQGAQIHERQIQIFTVLSDSPAKTAGVEPGDIVLSIDGQEFNALENMQAYIHKNQGKELDFLFLHQGENLNKSIAPQIINETGEPGIGVGLAQIGIVSYPWHFAVIQGAESTVYLTKEVISAFYQLIKNIIVKQEVAVELSGPVGIAVLTGKVARMGFVYILQFAALLTINLAVVNFLPFPALDGGRVLFLIIEKIRGKAVSFKTEAVIHNVGFILLLLLLALVTFRDIFMISDKIIGGLKSIIGF